MLSSLKLLSTVYVFLSRLSHASNLNMCSTLFFVRRVIISYVELVALVLHEMFVRCLRVRRMECLNGRLLECQVRNGQSFSPKTYIFPPFRPNGFVFLVVERDIG